MFVQPMQAQCPTPTASVSAKEGRREKGEPSSSGSAFEELFSSHTEESTLPVAKESVDTVVPLANSSDTVLPGGSGRGIAELAWAFLSDSKAEDAVEACPCESPETEKDDSKQTAPEDTTGSVTPLHVADVFGVLPAGIGETLPEEAPLAVAEDLDSGRIDGGEGVPVRQNTPLDTCEGVAGGSSGMVQNASFPEEHVHVAPDEQGSGAGFPERGEDVTAGISSGENAFWPEESLSLSGEEEPFSSPSVSEAKSGAERDVPHAVSLNTGDLTEGTDDDTHHLKREENGVEETAFSDVKASAATFSSPASTGRATTPLEMSSDALSAASLEMVEVVSPSESTYPDEAQRPEALEKRESALSSDKGQLAGMPDLGDNYVAKRGSSDGFLSWWQQQDEIVSDSSNPVVVDSVESEGGFAATLEKTMILQDSSMIEEGTAPERLPLSFEERGLAALPRGLTEVIRFVATEEGHQARVVVEPPALGRVDIAVQTTGNGMEAVLRVDNEELRQTLLGQLDQLRQALAQQGITVGQLSVDVRQQEQQQNSLRNGNSRQGNRLRGVGSDAVDGDEEVKTMRLDLEKGLLHWVA